MWMPLLLLISVHASIGSAASERETFPTPPIQTSAQRQTYATKRAFASQASTAATPQVLAFLDLKEVRSMLDECCPQVASRSANALLELWRAELRSTEVAHNFPVNSSITADMNLELLESAEFNWWLNPWQIAHVRKARGLERLPSAHDLAKLLLGATVEGMYGDALVHPAAIEGVDGGAAATLHDDPGALSADAEVTIFGCPAFAAKEPTWSEASDRLVYGAQNMRRIDTGSAPIFGEIGAIFKPSAVSGLIEIAAMDTGIWEGSCNTTRGSGPHSGPRFNLACDAIPNITAVGTHDHLDHLLLPSIGAWAVHSLIPFPLPWSTVLNEARKLFERSALATASYDALPPLAATVIGPVKYVESNLIGNVPLTGVRNLVPLFGALFGTAAGERLRVVADNRSWPLVWALGDSTAGGKPHGLPSRAPAATYNHRWLDPEAGSSRRLNATFAPNASAVYRQLWDEVADSRRQQGEPSSSQISAWWARVAPYMVRLAPLTASSCSDHDACIGVELRSGDCVCATDVLVGEGDSPQVQRPPRPHK